MVMDIEMSCQRKFVCAHSPGLLNLDAAVDQMLANRVMVDAQVPGKPLDRLDLGVQPNKLIDLFGP